MIINNAFTISSYLKNKIEICTLKLGLMHFVKSKSILRQVEVAIGVPGRLRPRIFSTFGTTSGVGRQPTAPAAFNPGEIPGTHFHRLSRPQGTWYCRKEPRKKKSPVTPPGIDPGTVRLIARRLNHYATPCPLCILYVNNFNASRDNPMLRE